MAQKYRLNTRQKKAKFLKALDARMLNVTAACEAVEISRSIAYKWKANDPDFAEKWKEVEESFFSPSFTMILFSPCRSMTSPTVAIAANSRKSHISSLSIPNLSYNAQISFHATTAPQIFLFGYRQSFCFGFTTASAFGMIQILPSSVSRKGISLSLIHISEPTRP